jgi:hypothetical protein
MTRTVSALVVVGALLIVHTGLGAQSDRAFHLEVGGGWSHDARQQLAGARRGWNGSIAVALNGPRFGVRLEAMSSKFGTDETPIACFGLTEPCGSAFEKNDVLGVGVAATFAPRAGAIRPYVVGGMGGYRFRRQVDDRLPCQNPGCPATAIRADMNEHPPLINTSSSRSRSMGISAGLGLIYDASPVDIFVEARYHHLFASGRDHGIVPVTIGVRL